MRRAAVAALVLIALAAALALVVWKQPSEREEPPGEPAGEEEEWEPLDMAGPGYVPEGAPLHPPAAPPPRKGATAVDFDLLSGFDYDPEADVIPAEVEALHGKAVELRGVMYYAVEDASHVTDFYLMPNHMVCCFGTPRLNEIVEVTLKPRTHTQYVLNYYLIRGRLEVGAVRDEQGQVLCLYRIAGAVAELLR